MTKLAQHLVPRPTATRRRLRLLIGIEAREDIEKLLDRHVHLQLFVKVVEDWRNKERELDEMGIRE